MGDSLVFGIDIMPAKRVPQMNGPSVELDFLCEGFERFDGARFEFYPKKVLFDCYASYCRARNVPILSPVYFWKRLRRIAPQLFEFSRKRLYGGQTYCVFYLRCFCFD